MSVIYLLFVQIGSNLAILKHLYKTVNQYIVSAALAIAQRSSNDHWATFDLLCDLTSLKISTLRKQRSDFALM